MTDVSTMSLVCLATRSRILIDHRVDIIAET